MEKNILIVDDEPSIIKVLDLFLKKEGFNIDSASSISETYKKLKKKEYSMIFLDINLPDGKSLDYFDKIKSNKSKKYLLLGDMLELGSYSKKLHESIAPLINQTKIDKVFVKGKLASLIYKKISNSKKGKILINNSQIDDLIRNDIKNNDYLMIKASLATGFNKIVNEIKGLN